MKLAPYYEKLARIETCRWTGTVTELVGSAGGIERAGGRDRRLSAKSGPATAASIRTQVIGFRDGRVLSMPLEETDGLHLGDPMMARKEDARMEVGPGTAGPRDRRIRKAAGWSGAHRRAEPYDLYAPPPGPLEREPIGEPLVTGIRAIDSLLTCGKGQRIGIFGGSGVGKSTLLGAMSRHSSADVSVIALIGERNREVRDFIEHELGPDGLKRSVSGGSYVGPSGAAAHPRRLRGAGRRRIFPRSGARVCCWSWIRSRAWPWRSAKSVWPPASRPARKATRRRSSICCPRSSNAPGAFRKGPSPGFFTVLVEGDDFNEPICDAVRAILDGHIVLSRQLGAAGHYPAIDVLQSVSRLAPRLCTRGTEGSGAARSAKRWPRTNARKT